MRDLNLGLRPGTSFAVSDAGSTNSGALNKGCRYLVTVDAAMNILLGSATDEAALTDYRLAAGESIEVEPSDGRDYLHATCPAGTSGYCFATERRI